MTESKPVTGVTTDRPTGRLASPWPREPEPVVIELFPENQPPIPRPLTARHIPGTDPPDVCLVRSVSARQRSTWRQVWRRLWRRVTGAPDALEHRLADIDEQMTAQIAPEPRRALREEVIKRALENAMARNLRRLPQGIKVAPNRFLLSLNRDDFNVSVGKALQSRFEEGWEVHLAQLAEAREYELQGSIQVVCQARNRDILAPGKVQVEAKICQNSGERARRSRQQRTPRASAVLHIHQENQTRSASISDDLISLGRGTENDIVLVTRPGDHCFISRHHATLRREVDSYRIFDGSPAGRPSRTGVRVNGRLVGDGGHLLQSGDRIILGPVLHHNPDRPRQGSALILYSQANEE